LSATTNACEVSSKIRKSRPLIGWYSVSSASPPPTTPTTTTTTCRVAN
jgi:hypothetical protein